MAYYNSAPYGGAYQHAPGIGTQPSTSKPQPPVYGSPLPNFNDPGYAKQPGTAGGFSVSTAPDMPYTPPQPTPSLPPPIDLSHLDFSNDPILARVKALAQEQVRQAEAQATASQTQLAIGYGDPAFAAKLGLSKAVQGQAGGNTFGTLQELGRTYARRNVFDINRPLSDYKNLFYSSERGRQLGLSAEQDLRDKAQAWAAVQAKANEIQQALVAAKMQSQANVIQAENDAYQRALQAALYSTAGVG